MLNKHVHPYNVGNTESAAHCVARPALPQWIRTKTNHVAGLLIELLIRRLFFHVYVKIRGPFRPPPFNGPSIPGGLTIYHVEPSEFRHSIAEKYAKGQGCNLM